MPRTATRSVSQIAEVLLCAAAGDLALPKKQPDWTPRKAVLLPKFLTEVAILHRESDAGELLEIFDRSITEWAKEGETSGGEDDENDEDREVSVEAEDKKTPKTGKAKQATAETLTTIAENCDDV